jgi:hypothetical protein
MLEQFPVFEPVLKKRGRTWKWYVCTAERKVVMQGSESCRRAARYQASRALLLLLCAPYRSIQTDATAKKFDVLDHFRDITR